MASYKLPLKRLSLGFQEFNYSLNADFFNSEAATDVRSASIDAVVKVTRKSDEIFFFEFAFKGTVTLPCDRCLDDMQLDIDTTYNVTVKLGDAFDDSDDEVLIIPDTWREFDVTPLMRDTVLLCIPIQHVHPEGECDEQMLQRLELMRAVNITDDDDLRDNNFESETNQSSATDPRWDALKKLKDNN